VPKGHAQRKERKKIMFTFGILTTVAAIVAEALIILGKIDLEK